MHAIPESAWHVPVSAFDSEMVALHALMRALATRFELREISFGGPQIVWSRSAHGWRRAGWRPRNHHSYPYSAE